MNELLNNLYCIHSMSGQETPMRKFIKKYIKDTIPGCRVRQENGNLYIVKGESDTYPCVVAHTDQVQRRHARDFRVFEYEGILYGFSREMREQQGLGGDDKNGIWIALEALREFPALKVAFFWGEETGCRGSEKADMSFFEDCRFVIQPDRRGRSDLITKISWTPICSDEFLAAVEPYATAHGYKATEGMMTDVEELTNNGIGLSCINLSCGYYNPHTDQETTVVSDLENARDFVFDIIRNCTEVYRHDPPKRNYYGGLYQNFEECPDDVVLDLMYEHPEWDPEDLWLSFQDVLKAKGVRNESDYWDIVNDLWACGYLDELGYAY